MPALTSHLDTRSQDFLDNAAFHRDLVAELDRRLARAADGGGEHQEGDVLVLADEVDHRRLEPVGHGLRVPGAHRCQYGNQQGRYHHAKREGDQARPPGADRGPVSLEEYFIHVVGGTRGNRFVATTRQVATSQRMRTPGESVSKDSSTANASALNTPSPQRTPAAS